MNAPAPKHPNPTTDEGLPLWPVVNALFYIALIFVACLGCSLVAYHRGIADGHKDLRCGLGTLAAPRERGRGDECIRIEVR